LRNTGLCNGLHCSYSTTGFPFPPVCCRVLDFHMPQPDALGLSKRCRIRSADLITRHRLSLYRKMMRTIPSRQLIDEKMLSVWSNANIQASTNIQGLEAFLPKALQATMYM
jgi:hypothetical protein